MKKLLLIIGLIPYLAKSQDVIMLKNGDEIFGKVIEVGVDQLKYKKSEDSPIYTVNKSEVFTVKYQNGTKDIFKEEIKAEVRQVPEDMRLKGIEDAERFYNGRNCGAGGTAITTVLLSPIAGLIPAIACSSTPPKDLNMRMPKAYADNQIYSSAYKDQSRRIKKRRVWTAFGVSVAFNAALFFLLF